MDLAIDSMAQADKTDITLACVDSLRRRGICVLVGFMTFPLPINHGALCIAAREVLAFGCMQSILK